MGALHIRYSEYKLSGAWFSLLSVVFTCEPGQVEARGNDTLAAVRQLCLAGPTQQQVDAVLQQYERGLEDQLQQNSFWLTQICTNYQSSRSVQHTKQWL